tara:strand:- start:2410 stop:3207 length:798 start_codon:yes stop_codon:yes gene_type:complete
MKVLIVLQARNASTRFKNKSLYPIGNISAISHHLEKMVKLKEVCQNLIKIDLGLCTTGFSEDDILVHYAKKFHVKQIVRGKPLHLWEQFYDIVPGYKFFMRICGDQPFFNLKMAEHLLNVLYQNEEHDYYSWVTNNNIPIMQTKIGLGTEIVRSSKLNTRVQFNQNYMEHLTPKFYLEKGHKTKFIEIPEFITKSKVSLSIDYLEDWIIANKCYYELKEKTQDLKVLSQWFMKNKIANSLLQGRNKAKEKYRGNKYKGEKWELTL